jgi:hypothetical protein
MNLKDLTKGFLNGFSEPPKKDLVTLDMYLMGRDKQYPKDYTDEVKANITKFLPVLNQFLNECGIDVVEVSSGWRPPSVNSKIANAAKRSLHMTGLACDLKDPDGKLDALFESKPDLLRKYGLFLEEPEFTKNWAHLDLGTRPDRPSRKFRP